VVAQSALSDFIAESETPIQAGQLRRVKKSFEGEEELWSDAVKGALEVVEAQCQATTQTLRVKEAFAFTKSCGSQAAARRECEAACQSGGDNSKQGESAEKSEEKVKSLEAELVKEKGNVTSFKRHLQTSRRPGYQKIDPSTEMRSRIFSECAGKENNN